MDTNTQIEGAVQQKETAIQPKESANTINDRLEILNKLLADTCAACDETFTRGQRAKAEVMDTDSGLTLSLVLIDDALVSAEYIRDRVRDAILLIG